LVYWELVDLVAFINDPDEESMFLNVDWWLNRKGFFATNLANFTNFIREIAGIFG